MPVTVVPRSLATVAIAVFITVVARAITNCPIANVNSTTPAAPTCRSVTSLTATHSPSDEPHPGLDVARNCHWAAGMRAGTSASPLSVMRDRPNRGEAEQVGQVRRPQGGNRGHEVLGGIRQGRPS